MLLALADNLTCLRAFITIIDHLEMINTSRYVREMAVINLACLSDILENENLCGEYQKENKPASRSTCARPRDKEMIFVVILPS